MKKLSLLLVILTGLLVISCSKEKKSERFIFLTTPIWLSDTLLANGEDASGPGELLEKFKGDAKFKEDGTGYFGDYTGQWRFNPDETQITIVTDSMPLPIVSNIIMLTIDSLKITTIVTDKVTNIPVNIRMTFSVK